jgi:predicted transposase/invertase (TIGR01784 family)
VLGIEQPLTDVVVLNPETPKETVLDKGAVLDVRARLLDGRQTNIEMQGFPHPGLPQRALFYWARAYTGQLHRGRPYSEISPTIGVFILNFVELSTHRYHSTFRLRDIREAVDFSEDLTLHFLELPKLPKRRAHGDEPASEKWGRFFSAETDRELEQLAMSDPHLREAKTALERLSADPAARELARERELAAWNYEQGLRLARREGEARGRTEGEARGRAEGEARGRAEGEAQAILRVLERRRVAISEVQREQILDCPELDQLEMWLDRALTVASAEELFA